ncbi:MAG: hypothetical protein EZS28_044280, partial [Streblomastix strix]
APQHILLPLLQNPPSVPTLFTPHNIGLPAKQLIELLLALPVDPVSDKTQSLKINVFPSVLNRNPKLVEFTSYVNVIVKSNGFQPQSYQGIQIDLQLSIATAVQFESTPKYIQHPLSFVVAVNTPLAVMIPITMQLDYNLTI